VEAQGYQEKKMIKRITIGDLRLTFSCARITKVIGVNSELVDKNHILMWDFDDVPLEQVTDALRKVQVRYFLSDIVVLKTKEPDSYNAWCFTKVPWERAVEIVAATPGVDWGFFRYSVWRYHFTLRVTPKNGRDSKWVDTLQGYEPPTARLKDLRYWVEYETKRG
jgi:hypothetical protein